MSQLENQRPFIPPSALFAPKINSKGLFRLRDDPKYGLSSSLADAGWDETEIKAHIDAREKKEDFFPPFLQEWHRDEIARLTSVVNQFSDKLNNGYSAALKDSLERKVKTRELIKRLFPSLKLAIRNDSEKQIFGGRRVEDFVDDVAFPLARSLFPWSIDYLPDSMKKTLDRAFISEVSLADNLLELISLGKIQDINSASRHTNGDIYSVEKEHEMAAMLNLTYLATISEITRNPMEEYVISNFEKAVSRSFRNPVRNINLGINSRLEQDSQGNKVSCLNSINIAEAHTSLGRIHPISGEWQNAYELIQTYDLRKFGSSPEGYVFFDDRIKDKRSRLFKFIRGRFPMHDSVAARFVLMNLETLDEFITTMKTQLEDWEINKEQGKTTSPESGWKEGIKFKVRWKKYPGIEFEMQVHYLKENSKAVGNWAQNSFGYKENFRRYRIEQFLKYFYPVYLPYEIYGINWSDPSVRTELFDFAYQETKKSALA